MSEVATIKKIVYGGWGLTHHDGKALFLPYTVPGDHVEFSVERKRKNCLFGRVTRIIEPSPMRREPECPAFGTCGGCHLLHMSYEDELEVKKQTVLENLSRIGRIETDLGETVTSPSRCGYRNHAVFRVDGEGHAGFTMMESKQVVPFPPGGCLLLPEEMRGAISSLPAKELAPGKEVRARMDKFGSVHFWGLAESVAPPDVLMSAGGLLFPVGPSVFFQVNSELNDRLLELVTSLPVKVRRRLLDLYCGVGFFTLPMSLFVMEAVGIEREPAAFRNAVSAARLNKISNVSFRKGNVEREIHKIRDVDLVIADPPRSGISENVLGAIVRLRPKELIIVSCEPPTLARDAARLLEAGFIISEMHLVDLFPGTYHVETVALFRRN